MTKTYPRSILITGASSGLGAALALYYARAGVRLVLTGRDAARLSVVADQCRECGAAVDSDAGDVTDRAFMDRFIGRQDAQSPIDLVIANAGISAGTAGLDPARTIDQARALFDVNVMGAFNTIDPVLPRMIARGTGQIAIVSSLVSFAGWPTAPAYAASKAAVRVYGEALRGALRPQGIRVNVICPGFVDTGMTKANTFKMPLLMKADRAAAIIARGLERNQARIVFPWPTALIAGLVGLVPPAILGPVLSLLPAKKA